MKRLKSIKFWDIDSLKPILCAILSIRIVYIYITYNKWGRDSKTSSPHGQYCCSIIDIIKLITNNRELNNTSKERARKKSVYIAPYTAIQLCYATERWKEGTSGDLSPLW